MNEGPDSNEPKKEKNYIKYPSSIILIIIIGLFIFSFFISFFSLKYYKKFTNVFNFKEYLELLTSGIYIGFTIINIFMENNELNEKNNVDNNNKFNAYLLLFFSLGYITNYFCEIILIQIHLKNNKFKSKYSSSIFCLNKNNDSNINDSSNSGLNKNESIISNESLENSIHINKQIEKRYSNEQKYFSIFNNDESIINDKEENGYSYDFTKKNANEKINNIYMYENLINKNAESQIYSQVYNEKNINSYILNILFNFHKLCQGLYVGINSFENKYFIFNIFIVYYFVFIDCILLSIALSKFQIKINELNKYIFIISFIYLLSGLIGILFKFIFYEIFQDIIKYYILGAFLYSGFNILDNYFYQDNTDDIKYKELKQKYYFCFFILGVLIYLSIFYLFK